MWNPTIQQFKELFNNEYVLNIMTLMNKKDDKTVTPTEISDLLQIHTSTAKKYLELITKYDFASKEILIDKPGRPSVYTIKIKNLEMNLSLDNEDLDENVEFDIWNPVIREMKGIDKIATFVLDQNNLVKEIKIKSKTKAKRFVTLTIELSKNEQLFMKYVPFSTEEPLSVIKICNKAKLESSILIKSIENFVKKLQRYELIEIVYD